MDRINKFIERKQAIRAAEAEVLARIEALVDEDSFVELSSFTYSKSNLFREEAAGEGVVTGFATIGGYPYCIVAQNFADAHGGLSKGGCNKIARALSAAEKQEIPVVYLLHSHGVRVGEGVDVLEGIAELLLKAAQLKGSVLQFAVLDGEVYGSSAALAALADLVIFLDGGTLSLSSPYVLSAKAGKNLPAEEVCGYEALHGTGLPAVRAKDLREAASSILAVTDLTRIPTVDAELNQPLPALNEGATAEKIGMLFESGIELGGNSVSGVRTVLGRVGGIAVAAAVFNGASVNAETLRKVRSCAEFACCHGLPFVTFVDCIGAEATLSAANSELLKEIGEYLNILDAVDTAKISVIYGRAIGLGYSLFAAKSAGFDYTFALATADIALFGNAAGAEIEFAGSDRATLAEVYAEEKADPVHAAKGGYLDDVVEPQFVKQYLIAALETLR